MGNIKRKRIIIIIILFFDVMLLHVISLSWMIALYAGGTCYFY